MDIFIGGVPDRNAALNGDIVAVEVKPPEDWKILSDSLYAYLLENIELQSLVYKQIDDKEISEISLKLCPDVNAGTSLKLCPDVNADTSLKLCLDVNVDTSELDVVVEEVENIDQHKKKRGGRGKKNKDKDEFSQQLENLPAADEIQQKSSLLADNAIQQKSSLLADNAIKQKSALLADNAIASISAPSTDKIVVPLDLKEDGIINESMCKEMENLKLSDNNESKVTVCVKDGDHISEFHKYVVDQIENKKLRKSGSKNKKEKLAKKSKESTKSTTVHLDQASTSTSQDKKTPKNKKHHSNIEDTVINKNLVQNEPQNDSSHSITHNPENFKKLNIHQLLRLSNWNKFIQKTSRVVLITEMKHLRMAAGIIQPFADKNQHMALFCPFDNKIPRMKIPMSQCPPNLLHRHKDYLKSILLARLTVWTEPKYAFGELVRSIGNVGDINAETEAILLENNVDYSEFPESIKDDLPCVPWVIPQEELARRTDLRKSIIFTIDPSTARDLDDAVSCLQLPSGNLRIGVHIADVNFFVKSNTNLDKIAADRATSVYLTERVIPMLPRTLCEDLCSLNPGEDRLTVSVIWEMSPSGEIVGEWFGRTVINSCAKLSYDDAQSMIKEKLSDLTEDQFPEFFHGHSLTDIHMIINNLQKIAVVLRTKRHIDGSLRLDQPKLCFSLDKEDKTPNGLFVYEQKESNKLIEEFMLLANMSVACKIYSVFPDTSVLRKHPAPHDLPMENTVNLLLRHGIKVDATSAGTLASSIEKYIGTDEKSRARMHVITNLCSKPMQYARYFCTGVVKNEDEFRHYALNVQYYTHFTSPIRRYADIMVHRLLSSVIDSELYPPPTLLADEIERKAAHCNDKKQASKLVQTLSTDLYFALFIRNVGEIAEKAIVIGILDRAVDVLIFKYGIVKRCYMEKLPLVNFSLSKENKMNCMVICWKYDNSYAEQIQKINFLDFVQVLLIPFQNDALKFNAELVRPNSIET